MSEGNTQSSFGESYSHQTAAIRTPTLVSISFTAVYDTGAVTVGAVVPDGSGEPFTVVFRNATGSSTSLP